MSEQFVEKWLHIRQLIIDEKGLIIIPWSDEPFFFPYEQFFGHEELWKRGIALFIFYKMLEDQFEGSFISFSHHYWQDERGYYSFRRYFEEWLHFEEDNRHHFPNLMQGIASYAARILANPTHFADWSPELMAKAKHLSPKSIAELEIDAYQEALGDDWVIIPKQFPWATDLDY